MKPVFKILALAGFFAATTVSYIGMRDDGGVLRVLRDEVLPLANHWFGRFENPVLSYASYLPASIAVAAGFRAGPADYDKSGPLREQLTQGIPLHLMDDVMQHDNLAAAMRARQRQLVRIASDDTEQRFFDLFPNWWSSHTACMTPDEELEIIRQFAPDIATRIEITNAEFSALAAREANGSLTVSERATYLAHDLRVPHLVQTGSDWYDWTEVDPSDPFPQHDSQGSLVRECPAEDHSYGWHIKACFGYVNIDLYGYIGQSPGYGHLAPTILGREIHRNLEESSSTIDFVLEMTEHQREQAELRAEAEQIVANLPASDISAGFEEWRVRAEYERLRCEE